MARIKAKPMNRLPIPPVVSAMGPMKNGFRPSPAAPTTTPAFDPTTAYPPTQQRFLYNGSSIPSVNYGSPVQIYVSFWIYFTRSLILGFYNLNAVNSRLFAE